MLTETREIRFAGSYQREDRYIVPRSYEAEANAIKRYFYRIFPKTHIYAMPNDPDDHLEKRMLVTLDQLFESNNYRLIGRAFRKPEHVPMLWRDDLETMYRATVDALSARHNRLHPAKQEAFSTLFSCADVERQISAVDGNDLYSRQNLEQYCTAAEQRGAAILQSTAGAIPPQVVPQGGDGGGGSSKSRSNFRFF